MKDKIILNNGVVIPQPGLGTYLTSEGETVINAVASAIDFGYRHIDTAAFYKNEKGVGEGIRRSGIDRSEIFVTSKVWNTDRGYEKTLKSFDKSLDDLGLDYVDLFLIHWPANRKQFGDKADSINLDTWRALEKMYKEGRTRAIGLSNFLPHHMDIIFKEAEILPSVDQIEYHPGYTQDECVAFCKEKGLCVEAWSPLGRGKCLDHPTISAIAQAHSCSTAQVIVRWVMQNGVLPLVKSVNPERIKQNFDVFSFNLSDDEMAAINTLEMPSVSMHPDTTDF